MQLSLIAARAPMVVASGSMTPALNMGDIAVTVSTTPNDLAAGEIISYYREGLSAPVIHRVVKVYSKEGDVFIVTKGDANNAEDAPFSASSREVFKTLLVIPKVGLVSIFLKEVPPILVEAFNDNLWPSTVAVCVLVISVIFTYHIYSNQPSVRLRRRLGR